MDIHEKYEYWLTFDDNTKNELESITDKKEIEDRFYKDKTTPRLIQFHTFKNAVNPPFLGGFSIFGTVAA